MSSRYLFEGHLNVDPEPAPPAWLVAQNLLTRLAVAQVLASASGSSRGQEEHSNAGGVEIDESVRESIDNMQEIGGSMDLDSAIEASLQVCFALISSSYHMACKFIGDVEVRFGMAEI